ncbi:MAG: DEAD/DEAH box helicase [Termitinemataceae bacterium]|nr:MAG: DEAD/DEAH box helicase [Termitinemataceae bacterium]
MIEQNERNIFKGIAQIFLQKLSEENISTPTEIQQLVIPQLLNKQSVVFSSQTGTGKTYAYLLPIVQTLYENPNLTRVLILSPTLELCAQIKTKADFLTAGLQNVNTALLVGSGNIKHQVETLKSEKPQILIGNTKRILQLSDQKKLNLHEINFVVLDEVDRLLSAELACDTKRILSFLRLQNQRRCSTNSVQTIYAACSATISNKITASIKDIMQSDFVLTQSKKNEILQQNITHIAIWCEARRKVDTLRSLLSALNPKRALVFTDRSDDVQNIVTKLQYHKKNAAGLYSGMDKKLRRNVMRQFIDGSVNILVSSDLAARGLDIPGINYIIETTVPQNADIYIHRAGRTARAGKKGIMISIGDEIEMHALQSIEKKLKLVVYPKVLYGGKLCSPDDIEWDDEE